MSGNLWLITDFCNESAGYFGFLGFIYINKLSRKIICIHIADPKLNVFSFVRRNRDFKVQGQGNPYLKMLSIFKNTIPI